MSSKEGVQLRMQSQVTPALTDYSCNQEPPEVLESREKTIFLQVINKSVIFIDITFYLYIYIYFIHILFICLFFRL